MARNNEKSPSESPSARRSSPRIAKRTRSEEHVEVSGLDSDDNQPNKRKKETGRIPTNLKSLVPMLKHVSNKLKGHDIDSNVSLRVVRAALQLQKNYLEEKRKIGNKKDRSVPPPRIREKLTALFGISAPTYVQIMTTYLSTRNSYDSGKSRGNYSVKESRIPQTNALQVKVRNWVRERRGRRERTTARQVLDFLVEEKILVIPRASDGSYEKTGLTTGWRNVRRWLAKNGYKRGNRKGNLVPSQAQILRRHEYLRLFFHNRSLPDEERKREIYLDESYIHEHYHRNDDSIWDPNDEQDVMYKKTPAKGRRYCFAAAIAGAKPGSTSDRIEDKAGLIPGSVWAFCPQKKSDHKGDYH